MTTQTPITITSNCWGIQLFGGIERCAQCEFYPFDNKGKIIKDSQCGGGQTLAVKIYKQFNDSIYSAYKASEFWKANPEASFTDFVQHCKKDSLTMRYSLRKYKRYIANLKQIAKEQEQHQDAKRLDQLYPYEEIEEAARTKKNVDLKNKNSYHYVPNNLCDCQITTTKKGAYRNETYKIRSIETNQTLTLYYLHQIVLYA